MSSVRNGGGLRVTSLKIRGVLVLVVGAVLGLTVTVGGTVLSERQARAPQRDAPIMSEENLRLLGEVIERVRREYVDPVDDRQLIESAIRGVIAELDAHSRYLSPAEYDDIRISTSGNYSGVGLDVRIENGKVTVISPLDGTPAARAGILPGDVLVSVDDVRVDGDNRDHAASLLRGRPGTPVTLELLREGAGQPLRFALVRAEIQVRSVAGELIGPRLAYVRLTGFTEHTARDLDATIAALTEDAGAALEGLVLDLRNNPGGVFEAAVEVADRFIDHGLIVRSNGRYRSARFDREARSGDSLENVPVSVLINRGSASASEIVAGALKDHGRAQLVGERSYGKGSIQTVMPLSGGGAVKLTTSRYLTPAGRAINETGIDPDVLVLNADPRRQFRGSGSGISIDEDNQLREALRLIGFDPHARRLSP
jgi:carboxyl-terminal processing protease